MSDIRHLDRGQLPSNGQLIKATSLALVVAAAVLISTVLPAEYGIDPTGIGKGLGLVGMSTGTPAKAPAAEPGPDPALTLDTGTSQVGAVWRAPSAPRSDEYSVTLKPAEGIEVKADMKAGERFVFSWSAKGGAVSFDMHGERPNAGKDDFTSYWKGRSAQAGDGEFVAPFTGRHGWYWENRGDKPVTITLRTTGFYERLYKI